MSEINVLYHSCPFDLSGYGTVARNHLLQLAKIEQIKLRLRTKRFWQGVNPDLRDDGKILHDLEVNPISNDDFIFLHHLTPENFFIEPRSKYHICYTPFETDSVPQGWLLPMRGMDEVWVPSKHNRDAYINNGLSKKKVTVIPHGVDVARYNPSIKPLEYARGGFNIGSIFDWTERKNPVALIRAYYNAFKSTDDVTLTIRTFWRFPIERTREYIQSEINRIKSTFQGRTDFPKIQLWFDTMDDAIMPNFYRSFDCFVLPTRGEGFGLPLLEAMACGVPTIGPAWGGNIEFMNNQNSLLVSGRVIPINDHQFLRLQPQYSGQRWFDADENHLCESIKWVYKNRDEAKKLADKGVSDVQSMFTWEIAANRILNRLVEIQEEI